MERLLVVDGSNLLFQMFYGMPARIVNAEGKAIQGTLGFVGALLKVIRMVEPTHAVVLFDGECANPRRELDPEYKAGRTDFSQLPEEETPFSQLPDIRAALDWMGIRRGETTACEADDWIAGYARHGGKEREVVILSQDSDFFQLIGPRVSVLRYRGKKSALCTPEWVRERLGIRPEQYAAYKALTGDTADHIRGVERVGPRTAAALLGQFGGLDALLAGTEKIRKPSVRRAVEENRERIRTNHALIALTGDQPLPFLPEELVYCYDGVTTGQVLAGIGLRP